MFTVPFLAFRSHQPELLQSCTPHAPCLLYLSLHSGLTNQNSYSPAHLTHHVYCTFPSIQVSPTRTPTVLHTSRTMFTVPFLAFRSHQPELLQSCTPHAPCLLYLSLHLGLTNQNSYSPAHLTHHVYCTFPSIQVSPTRTPTVLHTSRTMFTVPFLAFRSHQPELLQSCTPHAPCLLYLSLHSGLTNQNSYSPAHLTHHVYCTFPRIQVSPTRTPTVLHTSCTMFTVPFLATRTPTVLHTSRTMFTVPFQYCTFKQ